MNIQKIINRVASRFNTDVVYPRNNISDKNIPKYFNMPREVTFPIEQHKQLRQASRVIANYAKSNNVKVSVIPDYSAPFDSFFLAVNKKNNPHIISQRLIKINPKDEYIHKVPRILHDPSEGIEYIKGDKEVYVDTFLRHVYRTIDSMTKSLKG